MGKEKSIFLVIPRPEGLAISAVKNKAMAKHGIV
jgi:hypothetical protein